MKRVRKQLSQASLFLHLFKNTYLPGPFRKVYAVAMIWGGCLGGFFAGTVAAGYDAAPWLTVLSACFGAIVGIGFALGLVPKK